MSDLTKVIGKELLVHEVTRLSQAAKEQKDAKAAQAAADKEPVKELRAAAAEFVPAPPSSSVPAGASRSNSLPALRRTLRTRARQRKQP